MTTLSDIVTAINHYHASHGYPPDTIHLTLEQLIEAIPQVADINPYLYIIKINDIPITISDTFAIAGTTPYEKQTIR